MTTPEHPWTKMRCPTCVARPNALERRNNRAAVPSLVSVFDRTEGNAMRLRSRGDHNGANDERGGGEDSHRLCIAQMVGHARLDKGGARCDQHAALIGESRQKSSRRRRRKLVDVR